MEPTDRRRPANRIPGRGAEVIHMREHPDAESVVRLAAGLLRGGELVAVPTETVYGLLANADLPEAVERLNRVKGRAENHPYAYLIAEACVLRQEGVPVSPTAQRLIERFWPGPLTLVLRRGNGWCGFRLPDYDLTRDIVRAAGCHLVAPSANRSRSAEPTTAEDVLREVGQDIRLVLDGGPCRIGRPSTVVRIDEDRWEILREGAISRQEIQKTADAADLSRKAGVS